MYDRLAHYESAELLRDAAGSCTGSDLLDYAAGLAKQLGPRRGERIALLAEPGRDYVTALLGTWMSGAAYVPLCPAHPPAEMEHVIRDAQVSLVLAGPALRRLLPDAGGVPVMEIVLQRDAQRFSPPPPGDDAMILYTSGTTGKPKGAVHTHAGIRAQADCLLRAWEWSPQDRILHFLPLHHTHGIVNKLFCALAAGARCDMLPAFAAADVWKRLEQGDYSVFMAVPTIYSKLIAAWEEAGADTQKRWSEACRRLRLMVSGSAALPVSVLEKWKAISGHVLLERYGMTEIGMALSNPLHGERRPGFVGLPLPGVRVRVVNENGDDITGEGCEGELQVAGANLFRAYWNRPEATADSFVNAAGKNWFRTGDMVRIENGYYKIAGRLSTDIIKTGGYKVSAIEIEDLLLRHPAVAECAVAGIPDETWGERVTAFVVLKTETSLSLDELKTFVKNDLAAYKIPTALKILAALPRNAMGKVVKGELKRIL